MANFQIIIRGQTKYCDSISTFFFNLTLIVRGQLVFKTFIDLFGHLNPTMLKLTFLTTMHYSHAETEVFDHHDTFLLC
jgi:hypothetical protein